jgi:hypothetical protein
MSALNGDKARTHRLCKAKLARRERNQALRAKLIPGTGSAAPSPKIGHAKKPAASIPGLTHTAQPVAFKPAV